MIERVIEHYRQHVYRVSKREPLRPFKHDSDDRATAQKFVMWCADKRVDPIRMIDARCAWMLERRNQLPGFRQLAAEHLVLDAQRAEESESAAATQTAPAFDQTVRDLTVRLPGHDQVRRRYYLATQAVLCLANDANGGYEPRSSYCAHCPQSAACAAKTNSRWGFDVAALRAGRLDLLPPAVMRALRGWSGDACVSV